MNEEEKAAFVGHIPELVQHAFGPSESFGAELSDYQARVLLLVRDVAKCNQPLRKSPNNQFWRRTVVKNLFAVLEASAYAFKRIAFHLFQSHEINFSAAEVAILLEEKYSLQDNGEVRTTGANFQRFIPNLKFAFKCFAKAYGFAYTLDTSQVPLKEFEELRNRITHPKKLSELTITDAELEIMQRVWTWFSEQHSRLLTSARVPPKIKLPPIPKSKLHVTKNYIVMLPDGNVFQFDTRKNAVAFKKSHTVKNAVIKPILMKQTELPVC